MFGTLAREAEYRALQDGRAYSLYTTLIDASGITGIRIRNPGNPGTRTNLIILRCSMSGAQNAEVTGEMTLGAVLADLGTSLTSTIGNRNPKKISQGANAIAPVATASRAGNLATLGTKHHGFRLIDGVATELYILVPPGFAYQQRVTVGSGANSQEHGVMWIEEEA